MYKFTYLFYDFNGRSINILESTSSDCNDELPQQTDFPSLPSNTDCGEENSDFNDL